MQQKKFECEIGGKQVEAVFSDLAEQANGSVMLRMGDSMVLVTAVMGNKERLDIDYFPLSVEYEERFYAAGQILGSRFIRREGRPSDDAILSGRIVDRTIRPLFNPVLRKDVQVVVTVLSIDQDDPDVLGVIAASLALGTSDIPWGGPVSAVRIGKKKGSDTFIVNPTYAERNADDAELDLLVCGKDGVITMIEVGAKEVSEAVIAQAFIVAMAEIEKAQAFQKQVIAAIGKTKKEIKTKERNPEIAALFAQLEGQFEAATFPGKPGKETQKTFADTWKALIEEKLPTEKDEAAKYLDERVETIIRDKAIKEKKRVDGRAMDEIRPLFAQAGGASPVLHGSGIFYRGQTHIFTALTLGGPDDEQVIDSIEGQGVETKKRFMHHYNFPPYSVGETGRFGGLNRRMVGHGALAEKALAAVIPAKDQFPYVIRLVSEAFSSNGSTSMGSVCGSTLALMDGGVPIKAPVAGIAMGIMYESPTQYAILTDIQGAEDHHGDMDFKVAGTKDGVTAIQLDVKLDGIPPNLMVDALAAARVARMKILDVITAAIAAPRAELSPRAPKIVSLQIPVDMIGLVIGPSGKTIRSIEAESGATGIAIEEDGSIFITGVGDAAEKAAAMIRDMTRVFQPGDVIEGPVTRLMDFGAFVKLGAGKQEGLVHISEFAPFRIASVKEAVAVGETVRVVIKEIDDQGRVNLSIKMVDPEFATRKGLQPAPADAGGGHGPRRDFGNRGHGHGGHKPHDQF
jgi:polyribonucleotide nucleotidyltransferase